MKIPSRTLIAVAAAVLSLATLGTANAQPMQQRPGQGGPKHPQVQPHRPGPGPGPMVRPAPPRAHSSQDYRPGRQYDRRGFPSPHAEWRRGGRVPTEYRGRNYVVNDWRGHRLQAPPRGYQWVGVGGDYVLAAIATGLIAQIIAGR